MELLLIVLLSFGAVVAALLVGERLERRAETLGCSRQLQGILQCSAKLSQQLLQEGLISEEKLPRVTELLTMYMLRKNGLSVNEESEQLIRNAAANICRENSNIF